MRDSRKNLEASITRKRVEAYLNDGKSISKAAKLAETSYNHAKQIAEQMEKVGEE